VLALEREKGGVGVAAGGERPQRREAGRRALARGLPRARFADALLDARIDGGTSGGGIL
jgi:hypothetical protein